MNRYSLTHLPNGALLQTLHDKVALGRLGTAEVVALIAEVEKRKLHRQAGCSSIFVYCIKKLGFSEDEASRRVHSARAARRFPIIFEMIADGRLHLTGVRLLRPYLTHATVNGLLRASIGKTRKEIEQMLADRCPRPSVPTQVVALPPTSAELRGSGNWTQPIENAGGCDDLPAPERVNSSKSLPDMTLASPEIEAPPVPPVIPAQWTRVEPLGAERFGLHTTINQKTNDLLVRAQELIVEPTGDKIPSILYEALLDYVAKHEKRKLAATDRPRVGKPSTNPRYIPARVKRAVEERDGGQCAFVGDGGHRCEERRGLEFDHIVPVARGGESTIANVRQLCRAHNQLEAERAYGFDLMEGKRRATAERATQAERAEQARSA
jgi:5-methylcytosine-specific restriction endonuclease McrA